MSLILIIICIWGASALIRASKEVKAERERQRQREEQAKRSAELARMTAEWKQRQEEAKIETARLIALEREQMRQAKEQRLAEERAEKERIKQEKLWEKQRKEDEARDAKIAKLEAEQRKMRFQLDQIAEDLPLFQTELERLLGQVEDWQNRLHKAELDLEWDELRMREAPSAVKGKEHSAHIKAKEQAEGKIISLEKSIRKVEKQIATAEFNKAEIQRKLSA